MNIFINRSSYRSCMIYGDKDVDNLFTMATKQALQVQIEIMAYIREHNPHPKYSTCFFYLKWKKIVEH